MAASRTRVNLTPQFSLEPSISINWVDLPTGSFTTKLIGSRVTFTITPRMFASALVQYNSSRRLVSANARLRWEYRPASELFLQMRSIGVLLPASVFLVMAIACAQQPPFKPVASLDELMDAVIIPSSNAVFDAAVCTGCHQQYMAEGQIPSRR